MRIISTKTHGILDYLMGVLLIVSPWLFGFADVMIARNIIIAFGAIMLLMSLLTNYEAGPFKLFSMGFHLTMDFILGVLLALSPWLFGFYSQTWMPHLILGLFQIAASLTTETVPFAGKNVAHL